MRVLLTGASGFVGKHILEGLNCHDVRIIGRQNYCKKSKNEFFKSTIDKYSDYSDALECSDIVIHCAAKTNLKGGKLEDQIAALKETNTLGTANLAEQAAKSGVKRFIFISSIKVNGENTQNGRPFVVTNDPSPTDPYGRSKYEAEQCLRNISETTNMEIVIIRPPLVYGINVRANFSALLNAVSKRVPLPFSSLKNNRRSIVYVGNLVNLVVNCIDNPKAANQTFLVSDDEDLSTRELIGHIGLGLGKKPILFPMPEWMFRTLGILTGKSDLVQRLIGSLEIDIEHTKETLNWSPPYTVDQGMKATAAWFLKAK